LSIVAGVIIVSNAGGDGQGPGAAGSITAPTTTTPDATLPTTTTPTATTPTATTPSTAAADPGTRLLTPTDAGLGSTYEVSGDAYDASQTTLEGDYPIDCGGTYPSEAFGPQSREATTWRRDAGNWLEVVDVYQSSGEATDLMNAILDELIKCTASPGPLRPLTWFEWAGDSAVEDLGDETWSGESLLGNTGVDHTIFTVTRIDNLVVYTQMYSFGGEVIDRDIAWDLARRAVERAAG